MLFLKTIYRAILHKASQPTALYGLCALAFLESCILPFSPLILLIPMVLASPERGWRLTMITTLFACFGSACGYAIGLVGMTHLEPLLTSMGYLHTLTDIRVWFQSYGLWVLFIASIFPIPFKLFTIASGASHLTFMPFMLVVFISRWLHFAMVPILMTFSRGLLKAWVARRT